MNLWYETYDIKTISPLKTNFAALSPCCCNTVTLASLTGGTLQGCGPVGFPHNGVLETHSPSTSLLLCLIAVDVSHADPATCTSDRSLSADCPLGVVLCSLEREPLPGGKLLYVQHLPARGAVWGQNPGGPLPELNQQVRLKSWGHPGVIEILIHDRKKRK